jgi:hypothetical protein
VIKRLSLKRLPDFHIELVGGEPTLHPDICNILTQLNDLDKCKEIDLVTNLAKPVKFYRQFDVPRYSKLRICASYHPEYDKTGAYIDKMIQLNKSKYIKAFCNVNLYKDSALWPKITDTITALIDSNVPTTLNWLHSVEGHYEAEYTKEFYDTFLPFMSGDKALIITRNEDEGLHSSFVRYRDIPYTTHQGPQSLSESDIRRYKFDQFKGFNCTPLMWNIHVDGTITNACTNESLDVLATNIDRRVKCPVAAGCHCEVMFNYYKHRNE